MKKLVLHTGLYEDADQIIKAANAPVQDVRRPLSEEDWDEIIDDILDCDIVITA